MGNSCSTPVIKEDRVPVLEQSASKASVPDIPQVKLATTNEILPSNSLNLDTFGPSTLSQPSREFTIKINRASGFEIYLNICSDSLIPKQIPGESEEILFALLYENINPVDDEDNFAQCFAVVHPCEIVICPPTVFNAKRHKVSSIFFVAAVFY